MEKRGCIGFLPDSVIRFIAQRTGQIDQHGFSRQMQNETREGEIFRPEITILDENTPGNILTDTSRLLDTSSGLSNLMVPYSTEGFAEDPERQAAIAGFIDDKFQVSQRGPVLDVGCGSNTHIIDTFQQKGTRAYGIDVFQAEPNPPDFWHGPRFANTTAIGTPILSGDIADIREEDSVLKDTRFGLILFNGSWSSGGNNWTVADGEGIEFKYYGKDERRSDQSFVDPEGFEAFADREKSKMLQVCKDQLSENGLIGVVSSRYAFHGSGWQFDQLPDEKLTMIDVFNRLVALGAKNIYIVGMSQDGFDSVLEKSLLAQQTSTPPEISERAQMHMPRRQTADARTVRQQLKTISNLPREDVVTRFGENPEYRRREIEERVKKASQFPSLDHFARIDAIFAEF